GLRCIGGTCSKLHGPGQGCTFDADCALNLYCDGSTCLARGNEQASCGATNECSPGFHCELVTSGGLCRAKAAQGVRCGAHPASVADECADSLVCAGFTEGKTPVLGACSAPADVG